MKGTVICLILLIPAISGEQENEETKTFDDYQRINKVIHVEKIMRKNLMLQEAAEIYLIEIYSHAPSYCLALLWIVFGKYLKQTQGGYGYHFRHSDWSADQGSFEETYQATSSSSL